MPSSKAAAPVAGATPDEIDPSINGSIPVAKIGKAKVPAGRGPRGQRGEVREGISVAARAAFVAHGYDGATVREIARAAGCDSALVAYYYGSKQRLFRECFNLPSDPAKEVLALLLPGLDGAGERLVRHAFTLYDERLTSETMQTLMRALMTDAATSQRFRNYIRTDVLDKVRDFLGPDSQVAEQIELCMAMLYGVVTMRYIVQLEPLASMPREKLVADLAPIVQMRINTAAGIPPGADPRR